MLIHDFIIKFIKFLNFLSFALHNFFENYIIISNPDINILKSFTRKLNNFEHKLMKFKSVRPKKRLHILFISFFTVDSKNFSLFIFERFFKLFVVFYLLLKELKKTLMQYKTFHECLLFFLFQILASQTKKFMISNNLLIISFTFFILQNIIEIGHNLITFIYY